MTRVTSVTQRVAFDVPHAAPVNFDDAWASTTPAQGLTTTIGLWPRIARASAQDSPLPADVKRRAADATTAAHASPHGVRLVLVSLPRR
jgi:hypothetical protein